MKRFRKLIKKIGIMLLAIATAGVVLASDYESAKAAGLPELFYATYWDIMYSLGQALGYEISYNNVTNTDERVSGKEMWDEFVEFACSYTYLDEAVIAGEIAREVLDDEIKNFMKGAVSQKGISMSQELYDYFKLCFSKIKTYTDIINSSTADPPTDGNSEFPLSVSAVRSIILSAWMAGGFHPAEGYKFSYFSDVDSFEDFGSYYIICANCPKTCTADISCSFSVLATSYNGIYLRSVDDDVLCIPNGGFAPFIYYYKPSGSFASRRQDYVQKPFWTYSELVNRHIVATNIPCLQTALPTFRADVSESACPEEVPEVVPVKPHPAIPDGWRVVNPDETPDPDKDPDVVFPLLPIGPSEKPVDPDDPGESEVDPDDPGESENPSENPDKNKNPGLFPWLDWEIDPNTGYRINPYNGLLYDPDTGNVFDPESGEIVEEASSGGMIGDVGGSIKELFPFCIPFDIVHLIQGMKADKAPPVFHFEYYFKQIDYTFTLDIDLTDYDKYIQIFRVGMQIFWILALMFLTIKISKLFI